MFWSKLWFFVVSVIAALAITIALVMPRPAERVSREEEGKRLRRACSAANIVMRDNARARIQLASEFSRAIRALPLAQTLAAVSTAGEIPSSANAEGRSELQKLLESVSRAPPSFVLLTDRRGRVVARAGGADSKAFGDSIAGYFLVEDILDGYLRDDLWVVDGALYRVAGSPVLTADLRWAGGIVIAQAVDNEFVTSLAKSLDADVSFYVGEEAVASSSSVPIHRDILKDVEAADYDRAGSACSEGEILEASAGEHAYRVVGAGLPGEAGALGAFYTVFAEKEAARGFMGTLQAVTKTDLSFGQFPWVIVVLLFLVLVGVGIALMVFETDRPLRRLNLDAVDLAGGERERLEEDAHRGKFGSIARSVNIAIDKMQRETKAAKKDLDQLLGPAPLGGSGPLQSTLSSGEQPNSLHSSAPLRPMTPPPPMDGPAKPSHPSEFRFDSAPPTPKPAFKPPIPTASSPSTLGAHVPPAPIGLPSVPPPSRAPSAPLTAIEDEILDEDDLRESEAPELVEDAGADEEPPTRVFDTPSAALLEGAATETSAGSDADPETIYFKDIYSDFLAMKKTCGESVANLTFERFAAKLRNNRDALIAKHGCKTVKFQVYEKNGKAALKASPVR